jgi:hypothetical protein
MNDAKKKEEKLFSGVLRLNAKMLGLVTGLLTGFVIFIATNWLVIRGGPHSTQWRDDRRSSFKSPEPVLHRVQNLLPREFNWLCLWFCFGDFGRIVSWLDL